MGRIQGQWVLNPTFQQLDYSDLDVVVTGSEKAITMVEGGALEVPEEEIAEGLLVAHEGIKELIEIQQEMLEQLEKPETMSWTPKQVEPRRSASRVEALATRGCARRCSIGDKTERNALLADDQAKRSPRRSSRSSRRRTSDVSPVFEGRSRSGRCGR